MWDLQRLIWTKDGIMMFNLNIFNISQENYNGTGNCLLTNIGKIDSL